MPVTTPHSNPAGGALDDARDKNRRELPGLPESDLPTASVAYADLNAYYRVLFDCNPLPMFLYDCETLRFLLVNDAAIQKYGYSQDEFLTMTLLDIRPEEDVPRLLELLQTRPPRASPRGVWKHRQKSGQIIEVDITAHDVPFPQKAARLVVVGDVTEYKRTERALRQSEQEQRHLAEHLEIESERLVEAQAIAKIGSWELNLTTYVLTWSLEMYRILGMDPACPALSYEGFLERVHPEDRAALVRAYTESIANGTPHSINHRIRMEDGSIKIAHSRCKTLYAPDGRPLRSIGTMQDITERKEAEQTLQYTMEGAHCLLWLAEVEETGEANLRWKLRLANEQSAQRFLALDVQEGWEFADAWCASRHLDDRERTDIYGSQETRAGRSYQQEFRCHSNDGVMHWLSESVHVESISEGRWRCVGVCTDITERKRAEEERNRFLTAKMEADAANHAKSEFLSRMSHELRTPLNAILGFGQILAKETLAPLQKESVQYILNGGRHLLSLINEILDLARVEAGHIELSPEPIALAEIVCESCSLVRPLAAERSISLTPIHAAFGRNYVLADRQRLKQALINLLSNAIKYNRTGGEVRVYGLSHPENRFAIAVQDTGPGIRPEDQPRLFLPFERLNASSEIEGTGLGLAMAHRLTAAMGGSLTVESLPGEGSTFFLELPLVPSPMERLADQPIGICEPESGRSATQSATILYIEDNPSNMRLMEVLLHSRPGIALLTALQGGAGLAMAQQHVPDLILLDLNLPDISGQKVLARLQASALTRDIPVIVLSADATASQIARLKSSGARAYLTKPLEVTEFLQSLDTILSDKQKDV